MIGWFRRRAEYHALIEADAKALIERFGEQAYSEARFRQHNQMMATLTARIITGNG